MIESVKNTKKKVRIVDIADHMGISKAAVASVLGSASGSIRVSARTRQNILDVAKKMNYTPNISAQVLAGKNSMIIGALIDSCAPRSIYAMLSKLELLAAKSGYRVMIGQAHDNVQNLFECYRNFSRYGADGVICFSHEYPGHEKEVQHFFEDKRNLVFVGKPCCEKADFVEIDRSVGIRQAVDHLYRQGRRKIGFYAPASRHRDLQQRLDGFRDAMESNGIFDPALVTIVKEKKNPVGTAERMAEYIDQVVLRNGLDAVIAINDTHAAHLVRELQLRRIRVPDDIAVIGHDNDDFAEFFFPTLSSIDQKPNLVAGAVFETLLFKLQTEEGVTKSTTVQTEFIPRESSSRISYITPGGQTHDKEIHAH